MELNIMYAEKYDELEAQEMLGEVNLALSGDIEDHVVLKTSGVISAVGKLVYESNHRFHLEVFGVRNDQRGSGWGRGLLTNLTAMPHKHCRSYYEDQLEGLYTITTVAKGESAGFYGRYGFSPISFSDLSDMYIEQCNHCPDRNTCQPVPLIFLGTI
ncbi:MAG TPA: hypothetical protein VN426_00995 [Syntrophomonadaceae bacterium]|nr:hypothetical protein [Syntrophomonadaceae bacterium]